MLILVLWIGRKRELVVQVTDMKTLFPLPGAGISAVGPQALSGSTGGDGMVVFGGVKSGVYTVQVGATGYDASAPVRVIVQRRTRHSVSLSPVAGATPKGQPPQPSTAGSIPPPTVPEVVVAGRPMGAVPAGAPSGSPSHTAGWRASRGWTAGPERGSAEIVATFQAKGAISPATALTAEELGLSRMFVRIMKRRRGKTRVFVELNGRYYLDEKALKGM